MGLKGDALNIWVGNVEKELELTLLEIEEILD
jgi:hypothetical protein